MSSPSDQSEYERIKEFLLWALGIVGGCITIVGTVVAILTYNDRSNMRNEFKETVAELKDEIKTLKGDAKTSVDDAKKESEDEINKARDRALREVSLIRSESEALAKSEARQGIERALNNDNFDSFVTAVAKKHIEPKVKSMVDEGFKTGREQEAQRVIDNMLLGGIGLDYGLDFFSVNKDYQLSEIQQKQLQGFLMDDKADKKLREGIAEVFTYVGIENSFLEDVFKKWAYDDNVALLRLARTYFQTKGTNFKYYEVSTLNFLKKSPAPLLTFKEYFDNEYKAYPKSSISLLDSKPIIDYLFSSAKLEDFNRVRSEIAAMISKDLSEKEISDKYLFRVR